MANEVAITRPVPVPYSSTKQYWTNAADGVLTLQRCEEDHLQFYPRPHCHRCGSVQLRDVPSQGTGVVHTFSVVHRAGHDGFTERVPYVFAIVELDDGPFVTSNIVGIDPSEVQVGTAVRATFDDHLDHFVLPQFRPVD